MPNGSSIFGTTGAWEDYSTPARDFRLLIAIDVVRGFPDRVIRRAPRYAMPSDKSIADVKGELQGVLASELASRKISYTRSDGSQWTLSLKEVIDRATHFEMAYNPNDCVELRWGAPGRQRGGIHVQAARAAGATREDVVGVPHLVPRTALADEQLNCDGFGTPPSADVVARLISSTKCRARLYDISIARPAAEIEPQASITPRAT